MKKALIYIDTSILFQPLNGGILNVYLISFLDKLCELTNSKLAILGSKSFNSFFNSDYLYNDDRLNELMVEFDILGRNKGWIADTHYRQNNNAFSTYVYLSTHSSEYITSFTCNNFMDLRIINYITDYFGLNSFDFRENIDIERIKTKLEIFYNN